MGNVNRKATKEEMANARCVIKEAYPNYDPVFGGHSSYGGHRAPRDPTISFRLRDRRGKFHSNVVWILPEYLATLTVEDVHALVADANGKKRTKRKQ